MLSIFPAFKFRYGCCQLAWKLTTHCGLCWNNVGAPAWGMPVNWHEAKLYHHYLFSKLHVAIFYSFVCVCVCAIHWVQMKFRIVHKSLAEFSLVKSCVEDWILLLCFEKKKKKKEEENSTRAHFLPIPQASNGMSSCSLFRSDLTEQHYCSFWEIYLAVVRTWQSISLTRHESVILIFFPRGHLQRGHWPG